MRCCQEEHSYSEVTSRNMGNAGMLGKWWLGWLVIFRKTLKLTQGTRLRVRTNSPPFEPPPAWIRSQWHYRRADSSPPAERSVTLRGCRRHRYRAIVQIDGIFHVDLPQCRCDDGGSLGWHRGLLRWALAPATQPARRDPGEVARRLAKTFRQSHFGSPKTESSLPFQCAVTMPVETPDRVSAQSHRQWRWPPAKSVRCACDLVRGSQISSLTPFTLGRPEYRSFTVLVLVYLGDRQVVDLASQEQSVCRHRRASRRQGLKACDPRRPCKDPDRYTRRRH